MNNTKKSLLSKDAETLATIPIEEVVLHPIVETHPVMSADQFEALKQSLSEHHQLEPVLLYRGRVIDGRHRCRALKELGADVVYGVHLPNNTSLDKARSLIEASETRRHQTPTQLAIKAFDYWKRHGCTQEYAVKATGGSLANLQHVAKIEKYGRLDIINRLRGGGKLDVSDVRGVLKYTDSLLAIVQMLKRGTAPHKEAANPELSAADYVKIDAIVSLTASWSEKEKRALIAKLNDSL